MPIYTCIRASTRIRASLRRLVRGLNGEAAQGMIEYALIIALISVACLAVIVLIGPHMTHVYRTVERSLCSPVNLTLHRRHYRCS